MNPMNWISPTGFSPCAAMPTQSPLISSSASGVSRTRSAPKRFCSPAVARKTPPLTPTSSPSTTTSGSSCIARASARLMASTNVASGIVVSREFAALRGIDLGQICIEVIEHGLRPARCCCQIASGGRLDALMAFGRELLLIPFAPDFLGDEIGPQPRDRLLFPTRLDFLGRTVACRVVGGRMVAEPVGNRLDEAGAVGVTGGGNGLFSRGAHRHNVIPVDLLTGEACGDRLLCQRFASRLQT